MSNKDHRDVFISYHTQSALHVTERIANELESRNISCWYAPRDCENEWIDAIMEAIDIADIFLLILNEGSCNSEQVKNEINEAFNRYSNKLMSIIVFQIDDYPVSKTVQYLLGRIHRVNGKVPPLEDHIIELANRVEYTKKNGKNFDLSEESSFVSAYISPNVTFVGRIKELSEMREVLTNHHHISISGMGGIGKTDLIREYISRNKNEYRSVLWGTYSGGLKKLFCDDNIVNISNFFRNPADETDDSYFNRKIAFIKERGSIYDLLVIDNFNTLEDEDLNTVLSLPISIIFTTRTAQDSNGIYDLKLQCMDSDDDLFALFSRHYPRLISEEDKKIILDIIHYVKGHTLSIILIAKLMRDKRLHPDKMLEMLKEQNASGDNNKEFIYQSLISLLNFSEISDSEKKVLANLVFIPYRGVAVEEFATMCNLSSYDDIDDLVSKNWVLYDSAMDYISFHPLIAHMINKEIGTLDEYCSDFFNYLIEEKMFKAKYLDAKEKTKLLPLIERVLRYIRKDSQYYVKFYLASHAFFHAFARHLLVVKYLSLLLEDDSLSVDTKAKAHTYMADAYRCMNDIENLDKEIKLGELFNKDVIDESSKRDTAVALITLRGWYYMYINEPKKAYDAFYEQLEMRLKYYQDDLQNIGWAYHTVAYALQGQGDYQGALDNYLKAMEYFQKINMNFAVANSKKALGRLSMLLGDLNKAKQYLEEALQLFIENVGEEHNDTALTKRELVSLYRQMNINLELANKYEQELNTVLETLGYKG